MCMTWYWCAVRARAYLFFLNSVPPETVSTSNTDINRVLYYSLNKKKELKVNKKKTKNETAKNIYTEY